MSIAMNRHGSLLAVIPPSTVLREAKSGDSVSVDGVCLTVESRTKKFLTFRLMPATEQRTTLGLMHQGSKVNLELPLRWRGRIGGHYVHGHVDGVGRIVGRSISRGSVILSIRVPSSLIPYLAARGSVAVNGVSLTVSHMRTNMITVSLMKTTLKRSNLGSLKLGDRVNVETDILAKYAFKRKRV